MRFVEANEYQKNIDQSTLDLFCATATELAKEEALSDEILLAAGKAYTTAMQIIRQDQAECLKIQIGRATNQLTFNQAHAGSGANSEAVVGLANSGLTLFGYGRFKYTETYTADRAELLAHIRREEEILIKLECRSTTLARFTDMVWAKCNDAEVDGRKIIAFGNDEIINNLLSDAGWRPSSSEPAPDGLNGIGPKLFSKKIGMCDRAAAHDEAPDLGDSGQGLN